MSQYAWVILTLSTLSQVSILLGAQTVGPLAPFLQAEWDLSRTQVGLLVAAFFLGASLSPMPAGDQTDRRGIRPMLIVCSVGVGIGLLAAALAPLWALALVAMFAGGLVGGISGPATSKAVVLWFPLHVRATAMSLKHLGMPGSGALAALLVPVGVAAFGWRGAFAATGVFAFITAALVAGLFRAHPDEHELRQARQAKQQGAPMPWATLVLAMGTLFAFTQLAATTYMTLFAKEALALPLEAAWQALFLAQLGGVLGRLGWGLISDRLLAGRRLPALVASGVATTATTLAIGALDASVDLRLFGLLVLLLGFASVGWLGVCLTLIAEIAGRQAAGAASGVVMTSANLGVVIGPPVFGLIVDLTGDYRLAWWVLGAAALAGAALAMRLPESPQALAKRSDE
ncbi:MAG: MFS transporter [Chloroflexi bacterium]|nr:MFS transporter [Chloroflexota bacterium]